MPFTTPTPKPIRAVGMEAMVFQLRLGPVPPPQFVGVTVGVKVGVLVGKVPVGVGVKVIV